MRVTFATQVADGRPATCPEGASDPFGDGTPSPMDLKCTYGDAAGDGMTNLSGKVLGEAETGQLPMPLPEVEVRVHKAKAGGELGAEVGHAKTDPQGGYSLSAFMPPGIYYIVVSSPERGAIATRRIELDGRGSRSLSDMNVFVPLDAAVRSP